MKRKYKLTLFSLLFLLVLTVSIGISYAVKDKENIIDPESSIVYSDEYLNINYLNGKSFEIKNFKKGDTYTKKVSITNVFSENIFVTLSLMDIEKSSDDIELVIYDSENNIIYNDKVTNVDTELIKSKELSISNTLSYTIMIKNNGEDSLRFSANILVYRDSKKENSSNFKETILKNNEIKESKTAVGNTIALEDEGLIKSTDNDGDTYYFRGAVENNYVNFGNFNWRIVRINGNGSVRLVLDSILDDSFAYNDDNEEVDDYSSKLNFDNSKLKDELNSWLNSNLNEYSKYIIDSSFCSDTSIFNEENNISYLNTYNRLFVDNTPSLVCMGNIVKNKIGVLSADEVVFAGAYSNNSNNKYYLFKNSITNSWWTMSGSQIIPSNHTADVITVNRDGSLSYDKKISTSLYLRPVISLDINTIVTGTGTTSDPYKVKVS